MGDSNSLRITIFSSTMQFGSKIFILIQNLINYELHQQALIKKSSFQVFSRLKTT